MDPHMDPQAWGFFFVTMAALGWALVVATVAGGAWLSWRSSEALRNALRSPSVLPLPTAADKTQAPAE